MSVIYLLLSISVIVALGFFAAFISAVRQGQFDDAYTPGVRILFEDELVKTPSNKQSNLTKTQKKTLSKTTKLHS